MICQDGSDWQPTEDHLAKWRKAHPNVDLDAQLAKMDAWLHDNPGRRKTRRGMPAFVGRWLNRVKEHEADLSSDRAPLYADIHAQEKTKPGSCWRCDGKGGWEQGPKLRWRSCPVCSNGQDSLSLG